MRACTTCVIPPTKMRTPPPTARPRRRVRAALVATAALSLGFAPSAPRDLDVGVPPGSPLTWGRSFPGVSPPREPLFPLSDRPNTRGGRSISAPVRSRLEVKSADSFTLVRILTWDLGAHLGWLGATPREPLSGRDSLRPPTAAFGEPLYWVSLAPLLRLLLHPAQVSRTGTIAHLVEIGDASLGAIDDAESESALRRACAEVRERVAPRDARGAGWVGATPRERMLGRFVREELLRVEPYDPSAAFGARILLFADEVFPILRAWALDPSSCDLQRNAVAALARYRTRDALDVLVQTAAQTDDPVVLLRCLAAIGGTEVRIETGALVERLKRTNDAVETVALLGALGATQDPDSLDAILPVARSAFTSKNTDKLQEALIAIARLAPYAGSDERRKDVERFLATTERALRQAPRAFQPPGPKPSTQPDRPDEGDALGRGLWQLATIAWTRLAPSDAERAAPLLDVFGVASRAAATASRAPFLTHVAPFAQPLYLETLGMVGGDRAVRILRDVARDTAHPSLSAHALRWLPLAQRTELALEQLAVGGDSGMRVVALETLLELAHKDAGALCRAALEECALDPRGAADDAAARFYYRSALKYLSRTKRLTPADCVPLLALVRAADGAFGTLPLELEDEVARFVTAAGAGENSAVLRRIADELLDFVIRNRMNVTIDAENRASARKYLLGQVDSAAAHRRDPGYLTAVRRAVLAYLLGYDVAPADSNRAQFAPPVSLEEEILLSLGRTRAPQAVELILQVLENKQNVHDAYACLALGMAGHASSASALAPFLLDADPFTRFAAYEALRHLVDVDRALDGRAAIDWMYAPAAERYALAEEVWQWLVQRER